MKQLGFLIIFMAFTWNAIACSCVPLTAEQKFENVDLVGVGKAVRVFSLASDTSGINPQHHAQCGDIGFNYIEFKVRKLYKGKIRYKTILVKTAKSGTMCGVGFTAGKSYILYATKGETEIIHGKSYEVMLTNNCLDTQLYTAQANKSVKKLAK